MSSHNSESLPYFIKPSLNLSDEEKELAYQDAQQEIDAILDGESNLMLKMVTINSVFKKHLPYYFWVGFYLVNDGRLSVGPYQGTVGCLHIDFGKGVCGTVAAERKTKIVADVHALSGDSHIACDPNSKSEIVVPVFGTQGELLGVFDVDSTLEGSFNEIDKKYLEAILGQHFS